MTPKKKKGPTKAVLARKVKELEAHLASSYHFASATLDKSRTGTTTARPLCRRFARP